MKFSHIAVGLTGIILGVGPANGGRPPLAEPAPNMIPKSGCLYTTAQCNAVFLT